MILVEKQLYSRAYLDITLYKTVMMIGRVVLILYRFEADVGLC